MDYNMIKHIHEEPKALENTLTMESEAIVSLCSELSRKKFDLILITGCGSSYHVDVAVKHTFENLMNLPVDTLPADEVAYYIAEARGLNPDNPKGFDLVLKLVLESGRKEPEMR